MSVPEIPGRSYMQVFRNLLITIALEEIGLAHIINAEGEKIQAISTGIKNGQYSLNEAVLLQNSVNKVIQTSIHMQMLLHCKLDIVMEAKRKFE